MEEFHRRCLLMPGSLPPAPRWRRFRQSLQDRDARWLGSPRAASFNTPKGHCHHRTCKVCCRRCSLGGFNTPKGHCHHQTDKEDYLHFEAMPFQYPEGSLPPSDDLMEMFDPIIFGVSIPRRVTATIRLQAQLQGAEIETEFQYPEGSLPPSDEEDIPFCRHYEGVFQYPEGSLPPSDEADRDGLG